MKHIFWDHLPFWFVIAFAIAFAGFDIYAMLTDTWIYAEGETE